MNGTLTDCIKELLAQADECKESCDRKSDFDMGRMQGLCEALGIIKAYYTGNDEVEQLLGFDIDKRYLS